MIVYQSTTHDVIPVTITGTNAAGQVTTVPSSGYKLALVPTSRVPVDGDFVTPATTAAGDGTGMPIDDVPVLQEGYYLWCRILSAAPLQPQFIVDTVLIRLGL